MVDFPSLIGVAMDKELISQEHLEQLKTWH